MYRVLRYVSLCLLSTLVLSRGFSIDPCKSLILPEDVKNSNIVFVIPTYAEYISILAAESVNESIALDDKLMIDEVVYNTSRSKKVKLIAKYMLSGYKIMTATEFEEQSDQLFDQGYEYSLLEQMDIQSLEQNGSANLLFSTNFSLMENKEGSEYSIVDLNKTEKVNCIYNTRKRSYEQVLNVLL